MFRGTPTRRFKKRPVPGELAPGSPAPAASAGKPAAHVGSCPATPDQEGSAVDPQSRPEGPIEPETKSAANMHSPDGVRRTLFGYSGHNSPEDQFYPITSTVPASGSPGAGQGERALSDGEQDVKPGSTQATEPYSAGRGDARLGSPVPVPAESLGSLRGNGPAADLPLAPSNTRVGLGNICHFAAAAFFLAKLEPTGWARDLQDIIDHFSNAPIGDQVPQQLHSQLAGLYLRLFPGEAHGAQQAALDTVQYGLQSEIGGQVSRISRTVGLACICTHCGATTEERGRRITSPLCMLNVPHGIDFAEFDLDAFFRPDVPSRANTCCGMCGKNVSIQTQVTVGAPAEILASWPVIAGEGGGKPRAPRGSPVGKLLQLHHVAGDDSAARSPSEAVWQSTTYQVRTAIIHTGPTFQQGHYTVQYRGNEIDPDIDLMYDHLSGIRELGHDEAACPLPTVLRLVKVGDTSNIGRSPDLVTTACKLTEQEISELLQAEFPPVPAGNSLIGGIGGAGTGDPIECPDSPVGPKGAMITPLPKTHKATFASSPTAKKRCLAKDSPAVAGRTSTSCLGKRNKRDDCEADVPALADGTLGGY